MQCVVVVCKLTRIQRGNTVDTAAIDLQRPIAAAAGGVVGSGDTRTCRVGQSSNELRTAFASTDIAAIQQDVAIGAQGRSDLLQIIVMSTQSFGGKRRSAKQQYAGVAMRYHADRCHIVLAVQCVGDLRQAVVAGIDHHDLYARCGGRNDGLWFGYTAIDQQQLADLRLRSHRRVW